MDITIRTATRVWVGSLTRSARGVVESENGEMTVEVPLPPRWTLADLDDVEVEVTDGRLVVARFNAGIVSFDHTTKTLTLGSSKVEVESPLIAPHTPAEYSASANYADAHLPVARVFGSPCMLGGRGTVEQPTVPALRTTREKPGASYELHALVADRLGVPVSLFSLWADSSGRSSVAQTLISYGGLTGQGIIVSDIHTLDSSELWVAYQSANSAYLGVVLATLLTEAGGDVSSLSSLPRGLLSLPVDSWTNQGTVTSFLSFLGADYGFEVVETQTGIGIQPTLFFYDATTAYPARVLVDYEAEVLRTWRPVPTKVRIHYGGVRGGDPILLFDGDIHPEDGTGGTRILSLPACFSPRAAEACAARHVDYNTMRRVRWKVEVVPDVLFAVGASLILYGSRLADHATIVAVERDSTTTTLTLEVAAHDLHGWP